MVPTCNLNRMVDERKTYISEGGVGRIGWVGGGRAGSGGRVERTGGRGLGRRVGPDRADGSGEGRVGGSGGRVGRGRTSGSGGTGSAAFSVYYVSAAFSVGPGSAAFLWNQCRRHSDEPAADDTEPTEHAAALATRTPGSRASHPNACTRIRHPASRTHIARRASRVAHRASESRICFSWQCASTACSLI